MRPEEERPVDCLVVVESEVLNQLVSLIVVSVEIRSRTQKQLLLLRVVVHYREVVLVTVDFNQIHLVFMGLQNVVELQACEAHGVEQPRTRVFLDLLLNGVAHAQLSRRDLLFVGRRNESQEVAVVVFQELDHHVLLAGDEFHRLHQGHVLLDDFLQFEVLGVVEDLGLEEKREVVLQVDFLGKQLKVDLE